MKRVDTVIISNAMRILEKDIKSEDGIANMACREAADRLDELIKELKDCKVFISDCKDLIVDWGSYAEPYFIKKHDLEGDLIACDVKIKELEYLTK